MSDQTEIGDGGSSGETQQTEEMNIIVKTSNKRESFQIATNADVKQLRQLVSERYNIEPISACLIFSGKILKDGDLLINHKMKDGHIVHLVIRDANKLPSASESTSSATAPSARFSTASAPNVTATQQPATSQANSTSANPNPFAMFGDLFGQQGTGGANPFGDLNQQFSQQLNNPEFMRSMLDNPLMQNLYSNPEIFRSIITSNPQFQQLIERNPELNHVISNPEVLRQTFEMMRNPAAFQELMRSHDRALSNLESLPGGYNALRRMYTEFQEPMLNAAQEQFGANSFATSNTASSTTTTAPSNTENREPLPNPWAGRTTAGNNNSSQPAAAGSTPGTNRPASSPFNLLNAPAMQTAMEQFAANPNMVQNLLSSPMMQTMMQNVASDPNLTSQLLTQSPFSAAGNMPDPSMFQNLLGSFGANSSGMQRIMNNPEAMQAITEIQQGYERLQNLVGSDVGTLNQIIREISTGRFNGSESNASSTSTTSASITSASPAQTNTTSSSATQPATTTSSTAPPPSSANAAAIAQMMSQMSAMFSQQQQSQPQQAPEVRFQAQLSQLEAMGFTNRESNLRALVQTLGDVERAIDLLLSRM